MAEYKKKDNRADGAGFIESPRGTYSTSEEESKPTQTKRKLLPPARRGSIHRMVIRRAVRELKKERSSN